MKQQRRPRATVRRQFDSPEGVTVIDVAWPMGGSTVIRLADGVTPTVRLHGGTCNGVRLHGEAAPVLARIAARLDGREWDSDTLADVADILRAAGLVVRDVD